MTATYSVDDAPGTSTHPLSRGASPEAIRANLHGPEDRAEFDEALAAALDEVNRSRDLTGLFRMLDQWRGAAGGPPTRVDGGHLEVRAMLEATPWSGDSMKASNPRQRPHADMGGSAP